MKYLTIILLLFSLSVFGQSEYRTRPNIIMLMLDDVGYDLSHEATSVDSVGAWSIPVSVPNMRSRFQNRTLELTNCFATPICTPSRLAMMTGKDENRNYIQHALIDADERMLSQDLRWEGYSTMILGKEQFSLKNPLPEFSSISNVPETDNLTKSPRNEMFGWDADILTQGFYGDENNIYYHNGTEYSPDRRLQDVINYADSKKNDCNPFLINYMVFLTHAPFYPTPYDAEFGQYIDNPKYLPSMVRYADLQINELINYIEATPELAEGAGTILLIFSDNGTTFRRGVTINTPTTNTQGQKARSNSLGTKVPAFVHCVGPNCDFVRGDTYDAPVLMQDLYATVLDLAKEEEKPKQNGVSFADELVNYVGFRQNRDCACQYYQNFWTGVSNYRGGTNFNTFCTDGKYWLDSYGRFYNVLLDPENVNSITPTTQEEINARNKMQVELNKLPDARIINKVLHN